MASASKARPHGLAADVQFARGEALARNRALRLSVHSGVDASCWVVHTGGAADSSCASGTSVVCSGAAVAIKSVVLPAAERVGVAANVASIVFDPLHGHEHADRNAAPVRRRARRLAMSPTAACASMAPTRPRPRQASPPGTTPASASSPGTASSRRAPTAAGRGRASVVASGWTIGAGGGDRRVRRYAGDVIDANIAHPGEYATPTEQHQP